MDSLKRLRLINSIICDQSIEIRSTLIVDYETPLDLKNFKHLNITYYSNLKNKIDQAKIAGISFSTKTKNEYDLVIVSAQKSREETLHKIAMGYQHTKMGGAFIIEGGRRNGIDSIIKNVSDIIPIDYITSKGHGKIALLKLRSKNSKTFSNWSQLGNPVRNLDGFFSVPGLFSYKRVDPASQFLSETFDKKITGNVIDLGCGWGFLSSEALTKCEEITSIKLIDNDSKAIRSAKLNIENPKATFEWMDISETLLTNKKFDTVICNPPFHYGSTKDIKLGLSFIDVSSHILKDSGKMLIVANVHLPYENIINKLFSKFNIIKQNKCYKIILASQPK